MALTQTQKTDAYQFFIIAFGAAPGVEYMNQLNDAYSAGMTTKQIVNVYTTKPQFEAQYPRFLTNEEFANRLVNNVVGASASEQAKTEAKADVVAALNAGWTKGDVVYQIFNNLANKPTDDAQWGATAQMFANKVEVAAYVTETMMVNTTDLAVLSGYVSSVTQDPATVEAVKSGSETGPSAQTFVLTSGTDVASANIFNAGQVYTPGGNDRINSLQDEDRLTGVGEDATLNATLGNANDNGGVVIAPSLTNINTVNVAFTGAGFAVTNLDLQDAIGTENLNVTRISAGLGGVAVSLSNIAEATANNLSIAGVAVPANVVFDYQRGVLAGSDDTGNLTVTNVNLNSVTINHNTVNANGNDQGFETLNLASNGNANNISALNAAELRDLVITGAADLNLSNYTGNATAAALGGPLGQNAQVSSGEYAQYIAASINNLTGTPVESIDGSAATGDLAIDITGLEARRADPANSGRMVSTTVTGGAGDDTIYTAGGIADTGLVVNGGAGNNTLMAHNNILDPVTTNAVNPSITNIQNLEVRLQPVAAVTVDVSEVEGLQSILLRNETANSAAAVFDLRELTAAQAAALSINHGVSRTNGINSNLTGDSTSVLVNLNDASGANDTVSLTLVTDLNNNQRFNLALNADGNAAAATLANAGRAQGVARVENITLVDSDNESNTVELTQVAEHTGTITLSGGVAGQFMNLDATANAYRYDQSGALNDGGSASANLAINGRATNGSRSDVDGGAAERIIAANVNATAYIGDAIIRVSDNAAAGSLGGQNIRFGAGNDTVIFDQVAAGALNRSTAGLTISDTVDGGAGTDVLALDGNGVAVTVTASEWTNVSNFEVVRLVGNDVAANNARGAVNSYNLTLTNELLATNGAQDNGIKRVIIVNDNDATNDVGAAGGTADDNGNLGNGAGGNIAAMTGNEGGVTIDARSLNSSNAFEYRGEEGASATADRFILADANVNGAAIIDGGAASNNTSVTLAHDVDSVRNNDVLEIRNSATVSEGDLGNVTNVGTLEFTNDTAAIQNSILVLSDNIVDRLVDAYQASRPASDIGSPNQVFQNQERLVVKAIDNDLVNGANTGLTVQASSLTGRSALDLFLGHGTHNVMTGSGNDNVTLLGNFNAGVYAGAVVNGEVIDTFANNVAGARVFNGTINLGGNTAYGANANVDTLTTYGAINLAGATLAGIENFVFNSNVTMTQAQYAAASSITFVGTQAHTLTILDSTGGTAVDLSKIVDNTSGNITVTNQATEGQTGAIVSNGLGINSTGTSSLPGAVINVTAAGAIGTAAADTFAIDAVTALLDAAGTNFQVSLTGLAANDVLRIDLPTADPTITTLAQLNAQQGVSVQADPFAGSTVINFGNDANGGEVVTLTLVGVSDAAAVAVEIV